MILLRREFHCSPKKSALLHSYLAMVLDGTVERNDNFRYCLVAKASKSESGNAAATTVRMTDTE